MSLSPILISFRFVSVRGSVSAAFAFSDSLLVLSSVGTKLDLGCVTGKSPPPLLHPRRRRERSFTQGLSYVRSVSHIVVWRFGIN